MSDFLYHSDFVPEEFIYFHDKFDCDALDRYGVKGPRAWVLSWLVRSATSGKMQYTEVENLIYYWAHYPSVALACAISKKQVACAFNWLCKEGKDYSNHPGPAFLRKYKENGRYGGTNVCFAINRDALSLLLTPESRLILEGLEVA